MSESAHWAAHPKGFAALMAGVPGDPAAFARIMASTGAAERRYAILFPPRSGSTWLALRLRASGVLGSPLEYLHPDQSERHVREAGTTDPAGFFEVLLRRYKTPNGVFGLKLRGLDVHLFGEAAFFAAMGAQARYFCLWREDIVAQGVSLYRAVASQRWHSYEPARPPPAYDADAIAKWVGHVADMENMNERLLRRRGIVAPRLRYEDFIGDAEGGVARFAAELGVSLDAAPAVVPGRRELTRIADGWNAAAQARFRAERGDFVAEVMGRRLVLGAA